MLRHFNPDTDNAIEHESLLVRVASVLAVRGEALDSNVLARYSIRAAYAQQIVGMGSEEAGNTLWAAFHRLLDEQASPDLEFRIEALLELLTAHGGPGESLMGRVIERSRSPTGASAGGSAASPAPAASTPDRTAGVGGGVGLGPSPGASEHERRGAQGGAPAGTPPWSPPPAAGAGMPAWSPPPAAGVYRQPQQYRQGVDPPPGLPSEPSAVETALLRQAELLAEAVGQMNAKGTSQGSSIKVQPQVK